MSSLSIYITMGIAVVSFRVLFKQPSEDINDRISDLLREFVEIEGGAFESTIVTFAAVAIGVTVWPMVLSSIIEDHDPFSW